MKKGVVVFLFLFAVAAGGCSGNTAGELYETAKLEELQNNPEHAKELYEEIIAKYPDSEVARKARQRLTELGRPK